MGYILKLHEKAHDEYIAACEWYENRQKGLGSRFMDAVEKRLAQISEHPLYFGKRQSHYREVKVEHFPFMLVYEVFERKQFIHIAAIYHANQNPKRKYRKM
jgi:plasmid stabilization system protein ParE